MVPNEHLHPILSQKNPQLQARMNACDLRGMSLCDVELGTRDVHPLPEMVHQAIHRDHRAWEGHPVG